MANYENPVLEDYKLLTVFKNIGVKLLQQLRAAMQTPPYNSFYKIAPLTDQTELGFTYLDHAFKTSLELFFNQTRLPKQALLATYYLSNLKNPRPEEIISYTFDLDYTVNDIYTLNDFAEHYLIEFHQNIKKTFSDNHLPFSLKLSTGK